MLHRILRKVARIFHERKLLRDYYKKGVEIYRPFDISDFGNLEFTPPDLFGARVMAVTQRQTKNRSWNHYRTAFQGSHIQSSLARNNASLRRHL